MKPFFNTPLQTKWIIISLYSNHLRPIAIKTSSNQTNSQSKSPRSDSSRSKIPRSIEEFRARERFYIFRDRRHNQRARNVHIDSATYNTRPARQHFISDIYTCSPAARPARENNKCRARAHSSYPAGTLARGPIARRIAVPYARRRPQHSPRTCQDFAGRIQRRAALDFGYLLPVTARLRCPASHFGFSAGAVAYRAYWLVWGFGWLSTSGSSGSCAGVRSPREWGWWKNFLVELTKW